MSRSAQARKASAYARKRLLAEQVGRVLERRLDLRAVEPDGAVDAAVADEDDVALVGEAARLLEKSCSCARGRPARRKIGSAGCPSGPGCGSPAARSAATAGRRGSRARRASRSRRRSCRSRWRSCTARGSGRRPSRPRARRPYPFGREPEEEEAEHQHGTQRQRDNSCRSEDVGLLGYRGPFECPRPGHRHLQWVRRGGRPSCRSAVGRCTSEPVERCRPRTETNVPTQKTFGPTFGIL